MRNPPPPPTPAFVFFAFCLNPPLLGVARFVLQCPRKVIGCWSNLLCCPSSTHASEPKMVATVFFRKQFQQRYIRNKLEISATQSKSNRNLSNKKGNNFWLQGLPKYRRKTFIFCVSSWVCLLFFISRVVNKPIFSIEVSVHPFCLNVVHHPITNITNNIIRLPSPFEKPAFSKGTTNNLAPFLTTLLSQILLNHYFHVEPVAEPRTGTNYWS